MSLEVYIACAAVALLPADLPSDVKWQAHQTGSFTTGNDRENWMIEIWLLKTPREVEHLDLPSGTKTVVGVSIQGSGKGDDLAQKVVDTLMERCKGTMF